FIISLLLLKVIITFPAEVDQKKALTVAKNFYEHFAPDSYTDFSIKNYYLLIYFDTLYADTVGIYIFNFNSGGWVVVASDDVSYPILSFSHKSELKQGELDNHITLFFEHYFKHISFKINCNYVDTQYLEIWKNIENNNFTGAKSYSTPVPSLLETNQTSRWAAWGPYFAGAPSDDGTNGCDPLAMSQIMKFWE
ncbi:MAG: Spi family protease inhibitor, partial [Emcibacter sp.]|nr:Spi family protease inhibitor [Emcibacter sp.]